MLLSVFYFAARALFAARIFVELLLLFPIKIKLKTHSSSSSLVATKQIGKEFNASYFGE